MPRKSARRIQKAAQQAMRIRCRYCDIKDTCTRRERKESYENRGIMTYCTLTPNRFKKKKK